ncbi:DUF2147 domain-containing protein [Sphingobium sp. Sx8-8]|uniref:DUF2147 domain-containing protein n=1 Tax=Sphingobium sp. Sx8-8 TaxID=2933617 RepID=UPI001F58A0BA|nr:DUF2147 domain-containing protein [Sphingobium sp. Sx8-8]
MGFSSALLLLAAAFPATTIEGSWLTDDQKGVVQIAPCGTHMCGRIARVLDKGPNVPATDVNNPDPRLRRQPIVGLQTLWGFTRDGSVWKGGRAYDPKSGQSYRSTLELYPDGALKVTGCVLFLCQSRRWTRIR